MSKEGASNINQKQLRKLESKAKELGYSNLAFFIEDIDVLLRPANLLKQKEMKYFELENLISLLISKNISLGMAPRMISMVTKYSERNEELEAENTELKQSNITMRSKYQTAEAQVKEYQKQLSELSVGAQTDARIREENIKLTEENKYLKMTNESLTDDLKKTKGKLDQKLEDANNLEVENSQLELRMKDMQRELKELEIEVDEFKRKGVGGGETKRKVESLIDELDELYGTIDDPFKKEFVAFLGVELGEIMDDRNITKQKILNQIAIHANEIEKAFEPRIVAAQPVTKAPSRRRRKEAIIEEEPVKIEEPKVTIPEPVKKEVVKEIEPIVSEEKATDELAAEPGDQYVKPSEFLKGKSIHSGAETKTAEVETSSDTDAPKDEEKPKEVEVSAPKPVSYPKKKKRSKKAAPVDRTPSPELVQVFDVFIKYLEAITDNSSFNDLCDKLIEELYEHVGSPGMTQVYKIKSGGVKRKKMLVDLLKQWQVKLPDM
jgi:cell division septation protein DedD